MNKPIVLDGKHTCYNCAEFRLCHGRRVLDDLITDKILWLLDVDNSTPHWQRLFMALAGACSAFKYQPDPPDDPDEIKCETMIVQVSHAQLDDVEDDLCGLLERYGAAKLYTHDMKEIV